MEDENDTSGLPDAELSAALDAIREEMRGQPVSERLRDLSQQLQDALARARGPKGDGG
ncbi:MAG: hypothetical protein LPJ95_10470 [Paracoccaceae bacterium]|nr:hypothetical protein [Paracoccaceae bacterium]